MKLFVDKREVVDPFEVEVGAYLREDMPLRNCRSSGKRDATYVFKDVERERSEAFELGLRDFVSLSPICACPETFLPRTLRTLPAFRGWNNLDGSGPHPLLLGRFCGARSLLFGVGFPLPLHRLRTHGFGHRYPQLQLPTPPSQPPPEHAPHYPSGIQAGLASPCCA